MCAQVTSLTRSEINGPQTRRLVARYSFLSVTHLKALLLLTDVVFAMGLINSYVTRERTRALLAGRSEGVTSLRLCQLLVAHSQVQFDARGKVCCHIASSTF